MTTQAPTNPTNLPHAAHPHMQGRDKNPWSEEVWKRLDAAVHEEMTRARVAARFLPTVHVPAKTLTASTDAVTSGAQALSVDEGATTRINEFWVEFILTPAQVEHEAAEEIAMAHGHGASTGITLATRAANILAQAEDTLIFQGQNAFKSPLFTGATAAVNYRPNNLIDLGLLNLDLTGAPSKLNPNQIVSVHPASGQGTYQGNTVTAIAQAYSVLQSYGQYGPYALVLQTTPYADAHSPLPNTLILPATPIKELITAGFFGAGTLPPWTVGGASSGGLPAPQKNPLLFTGILVSIGGNTMDLVRGRLHHDHDAVVTFEQKDINGNSRLRVVERFALRLKDPTAVVRLEFLTT
jgi:uncharacterized linocin/CFP29 family protein